MDGSSSRVCASRPATHIYHELFVFVHGLSALMCSTPFLCLASPHSHTHTNTQYAILEKIHTKCKFNFPFTFAFAWNWKITELEWEWECGTALCGVSVVSGDDDASTHLHICIRCIRLRFVFQTKTEMKCERHRLPNRNGNAETFLYLGKLCVMDRWIEIIAKAFLYFVENNSNERCVNRIYLKFYLWYAPLSELRQRT